jgi:hypothetical protein
VRAKDELRIHRPLAPWAQGQVVKVLEQVLLLQSPLKCLVQCLLRPQYQIQQQSWHKEQHDEKCRENLSKNTSAPGFDIPKGPGNERKPESNKIGDSNRQQKLHASRGGLDHERRPLSESVSVAATAKLSVPDTLETSDRKHENAGAAGSLFSRTGNPELRLRCKRPQWLDPSGTSAGPGSHERQDVSHLVVIYADHQCRLAGAADCRVAFDLSRGCPDRGQIRQ